MEKVSLMKHSILKTRAKTMFGNDLRHETVGRPQFILPVLITKYRIFCALKLFLLKGAHRFVAKNGDWAS